MLAVGLDFMAPLHRILASALSLALCAACGEKRAQTDAGDEGVITAHGLTEAQAAEPLVQVGDTTITVGEFADRMADQEAYVRARYNSPERRRDFLDNLIRFELLAAEAARRGFDKLPEVDRTTKQVMIQQMMKDLFEDRIQPSDIPDSEVKDYYEAHREEFEKPEQVRVSHIQMSNRALAGRILKQLRDKPNDVQLFRDLADKYNADPDTKSTYGDLRFVSRPDEATEEQKARVPDDIAEAAFAIKQIGGIHPSLVRAKGNYHIVKLTARRAALRRTLEEASAPIRNRLWRERREAAINEFVTKLHREAKVEENFDLVDSIQVDIPEKAEMDQPTGESDKTAGAPGDEDQAPAEGEQGAP